MKSRNVYPLIRRLLFASAITLPLSLHASPPPPTTVSPAAFAKMSVMQAAQTAKPDFKLPKLDDFAGWKAEQVKFAAMTDVYDKALLKRFPVEVRERLIAGVPVVEVLPPQVLRDGRKLVYAHGGAYTFGSVRSTLGSAAMVAHATGMPVISIDYTLAPQAKWKVATAQVISVLRGLQQAGTPLGSIGVFGDSAGGGLVAGAVLRMRDEGSGMPGALVLWSPWSDITESGDSYVTLKDTDFLSYAGFLDVCAAAYASPADQKNPYVSPVYGDYRKGYPPTLIQGGTREIFLSNFVRHYQAIVQGGQRAELDLYEGMPHVHQVMMAGTPESDAALARMTRFIKDTLKPARPL